MGLKTLEIDCFLRQNQQKFLFILSDLFYFSCLLQYLFSLVNYF